MKDQFPGYFRPSEKDFESLWRSASIALDASVLLDLYRYSDDTRKEFLRVLRTFSDRLWLPHRAAQEFFRNRLSVIGQQERTYEEAAKALDQIEKDFKNKRQHPFISPPLLERLGEVFSNVRAELGSSKEAHRQRMTSDPILEELEELFRQRIGGAPTGEALTKICADGKQRYDRKIPPGYKDAGKDEIEDPTRRYGDLILWMEVLKKSKTDQVSTILVLDDRKEDWWSTYEGRTIGPRPELIKEFYDCVGKPCYLYQPDSFLTYAGTYGKQKVSGPAVTELRELRQEEERRRKRARIEKIRQERAMVASAMSSELQDLHKRFEMITGAIAVYRKEYQKCKTQLTIEDPSAVPADRFTELSRIEEQLAQLTAEQLLVSQRARQIKTQMMEFEGEFANRERHRE